MEAFVRGVIIFSPRGSPRRAYAVSSRAEMPHGPDLLFFGAPLRYINGADAQSIMAFDDLLLVMVNLPYYVRAAPRSRHYYAASNMCAPQI
jgi:hypothetical protein